MDKSGSVKRLGRRVRSEAKVQYDLDGNRQSRRKLDMVWELYITDIYSSSDMVIFLTA